MKIEEKIKQKFLYSKKNNVLKSLYFFLQRLKLSGFNKSIKKVRDSDLVYSQKMFKDKLLGYFWFLVIINFFLFLYIFAGIVQFGMNQ